MSKQMSQPVVQLLQNALKGVKVNLDITHLNSYHLPETIQEIIVIINEINNGDIYIKPELDGYGERFHSTFTFTWATLRPLIYFENKENGTLYLDLSNSQYFFFSLLSNKSTYKLIPEYEALLNIFKAVQTCQSYLDFCFHARNATLYQWCEKSFGYSKKDLMKLFFGSVNQFKQKRRKISWLTILLTEIEKRFGSNILPKILQRLESRTLLNEVCFTFLNKNKQANLISIHDGILFERRYEEEVKEIISKVFRNYNLPEPKYKCMYY